jgi:transglutaminase-like putative cysteine protease
MKQDAAGHDRHVASIDSEAKLGTTETGSFRTPTGGGEFATENVPPSGNTAERRNPKRPRKRVLRKLYWLIWLLCVGATAYYANIYRQDQSWLKKKAAEIVNVAGASTQEEEITALRDYIRLHVRYEGVDQNNRPFLRDSAREVLESGRGWCGEATRAFICLARERGIRAQRVNLYGTINHVVAEVLTGPDREVLVDVQDNPDTNPLLDQEKFTVHQIDNDPRSPFTDYSNIHLRRFPFIGPYVHHIKLEQSWITWVLENPALLKAIFWGGLAASMLGAFGVDRLLVRIYALRFGLNSAKKS